MTLDARFQPVANSSWICFDCRLAVRRPTQFVGEVVCPECGVGCWCLGYKIPVPPKRDARAWRQLQESQVAQQDAQVDAARQARVRSRHDLEQEIRRLEAMPSSPGRAKAIMVLRRRLDGV